MIEKMTLVEALALLQYVVMRVDGKVHKDEIGHALRGSVPILALQDDWATSVEVHVNAWSDALNKVMNLEAKDWEGALDAAVIKIRAQPAATKEAVLELLQGIAEVDNVVHPKEAQFINGLTEALQALGENEKGKVVKEDIVAENLKNAEAGDADAQYNLGCAYAAGNGVAQNYAESVKWMELAANQGHADAQYNLGCAYATGVAPTAIPQNSAEAIKWYELAANQGHADAQYNLGCAYMEGKGVAQNYAEAVKWFELAANQGHANARHNLEYANLGPDTALGECAFNAICLLGRDSDFQDDVIDIAVEVLKSHGIEQQARQCIKAWREGPGREETSHREMQMINELLDLECSDLEIVKTAIEEVGAKLNVTTGRGYGWYVLACKTISRKLNPSVNQYGREFDPETEAVYFSQEELEKIPDVNARMLARAMPALTSEQAEHCVDVIDYGNATALCFVPPDFFQEMYASTGERVRTPLAVIPRTWVVVCAEQEFGGMNSRMEYHCKPAVVVATQERIYWNTEDGWSSLPYDKHPEQEYLLDNGFGWEVPEFSHLFGRGPFASFGNDDLGVCSKEGHPDWFDSGQVPQLMPNNTTFGYSGMPEDTFMGLLQLRDRAELPKESAEGLTNRWNSIESSIKSTLYDSTERGFVADCIGFSGFLQPFLLNGGMRGFLPRGLDPFSCELFRYPPMTISYSYASEGNENKLDVAGSPLRSPSGHRGATLPMFLESLGSSGGSYIDIFLKGLLGWWGTINMSRSSSQMFHLNGWCDVEGLSYYTGASDVTQTTRTAHTTGAPSAEQSAAWSKEIADATGSLDYEISEEYIGELEALLETSPSNAKAMYRISNVCFQLKEENNTLISKAEAYINSACEINHGPVYSHLRSKIYAELGDLSKQKMYVNSALTGLSNPLFFNQSVQFIDDFYIEKTGVDDPVARFNAISKILRNTLNIYPELCAQWVFSNPWTYIKERASQHALEQLPLSPECWVSRALTLLVMEDDPENVKEAQKIYALAESKFPDEDFSVILSEWGIKQEFIAALKGDDK